MAVPIWIAKIVGGTVANAAGKIIEKVVEFIPGKREYKRKQVRKLKDEIKKLQQEPLTSATGNRLVILTHRLSEYTKELEEE